jgi:hypothetical protein
MKKVSQAIKDKFLTNPRNEHNWCQSIINNKYFKVYHQSIRGIRKETHELLSQLHPDLPHILCFTEHHIYYLELKYVCTENYNLGALYWRVLHEKGEVVIYVHNSLKFYKY